MFERGEQRGEQREQRGGYIDQSTYVARNATQTEPPRPSLSHSSNTNLAIDSSEPPSLPFSRPLPLPLPLPPTDPALTPMPPLRVSPRPPPLRIARKKPPPIEAMSPPFILAESSPPALNNLALSPPTTTIQLPNTASTSASMSEGESPSYIPTPPLSDSTNSPPPTSHRPVSVEDKSSLPRPESVHFGPRAARNSKRVPSSLIFDQRRGVEIPSAEEFGVSPASYPVVFAPKAPQYTADEFYPLTDVPTSPTPSLPNPYTTSLIRTGTASSIASSTLTSSSSEFGPRPRVKPVLTLSLPDSTAAVSIASIAINDTDASLPNPFQPQVNPRSYFSPHLPQYPLNRDSLIQTGGASLLGEDVNTGFGVSYFSPHTPATTDLLSGLRTENTTTVGTGPIGTKRGHQDEKDSGSRASGLLVVPPNAAVGSYWSPHTPDVPEGVGRAIDEAVVKELGDVQVKETEFLKAGYKSHSHTPTTDATAGHSVEPSSTPPRDRSPHSSNDAITDFDLTASDSSSPRGNRGPVLTSPSKPQLKIQTWDLDKMRDDKKRQESTAVRRQGSKDKDARNRERKGRGKTVQKEAGAISQTTEMTKGVNVPLALKPGGVPLARSPQPPQQVVRSNNTPVERGKSELSLLPAALRPGSQLFGAFPPLALRSQPVLDISGPPTQGIDTSASLTQNRHSIATNAWGSMPRAPQQASLTLGTKSSSDTDRFAHGRSPSEPTFPNVGPGGTQEPKLGKEGKAKERTRFGFFGNTGGTASDTNLAGLAASGAKKAKDAKDVNDLKESRKSAFYSRGVNASFEALTGWGGKIFSGSSTSVNTYGASSKKGETDEKPSYLGTTVPPPVTAQPHPYAQYQIPPLSTLPPIDIRHQHTPSLQLPASNTRVHAAPLYSSVGGGRSFEDLGVEIGWVGKNKTHMPPHSGHGHGGTAQETAVRADVQPVKKGHTKNSSSGVSGFMKMFGFGKKDKGKDKQKWS